MIPDDIMFMHAIAKRLGVTEKELRKRLVGHRLKMYFGDRTVKKATNRGKAGYSFAEVKEAYESGPYVTTVCPGTMDVRDYSRSSRRTYSKVSHVG